jgi:hypothetical protein
MAVALTTLMLVAVSSFAAVNVAFLAAGSTGAFETMGLAAYETPINQGGCGSNVWTLKNGASGVDGRTSGIPLETGNVWIVWDNSTAPTVVCAYLAVDSVIGSQLFFAVPRATLSIPSSEIGEAGGDLIPTLTDTPLPQAVYTAINGLKFNCAPADIRPEDALFAVNRALGKLNKQNYDGLGYGPGPVGIPIQSTFSTKNATPVAFAISGTDPITKEKVPSWSTIDVGAYPVMVFVNTTVTGSSGDFSNATAFQNVNRLDLTNVLNGTSPYTRDLTAASGLESVPVNICLREPTSGTYNTIEFNIPRNVEIGSTQELGVNPGVSGGNPLDIANPYSGGWRKRVIGTGEMVSEVGIAGGANGNVLGYAFWGTGNFANVVNTTRYLTVDGVDPLFAAYTGGVFPTCSYPCPGEVQFTNVLNGSYPIWAMLNVTTDAKVPPGVLNLVKAAQAETQTFAPDFVPYSQMTVFLDHFQRPGMGKGVKVANGVIQGLREAGGDEGGMRLSTQSDVDNYTDTGKEITGYQQ